MKLHFTKSTSDALSILNSILNQNGIKTDLDKVADIETEESVNENRPERKPYIQGLVGGFTKEEEAERDAEIEQYNRTHSCYKDSDGLIHIVIRVDSDRFFLAMGGKFKDSEGIEQTYHNYLLYHDADLNGDISGDELAGFIRCYNLPESERRAEHLKVWDSFTKKSGTRLSQLSPEKRIEWLMRGVKK